MSQSSGLGDRARQALLESASETGPDGLSADERQLVEQLRARDREVRNHEEAHARVGGQYAGAPSYDLQAGPDGRSYAIGGSVPIDVSPVRGDPEATIVKMEVVKAAALAPAKPSAADRNIAALADANRLEALAQLASQRRQSPEADADDARGPLVAAAEALTRMARLLSDGVDMIGRGVVDQAV
ncbi:MAG: putative metalloprotease CJM1_0395 family protein [Pseudomonadota bacterium]